MNLALCSARITKHAEQSAKRLFSKACISACIQEKAELPGTVLCPEVLL